MSNRSLDSTLDYLRRLVVPPDFADVADAVLVERFLTAHDGDAFALLLRRHGPMVLGVARRILTQTHDAEEAFQATFLVLAARAQRLRRRELVAAWLHGVAVRVAMRLASERRQLTQRHIVLDPAQLPAPPADESLELREVIDRELEAIPEPFRATLLLCDLEGETLEDAARKLGCSEGTVRGRLWRGRKLLRDGLTRRGLSASVPLVLGLPLVPDQELLGRTLRGARLFVAGAAEFDSTTRLAQGVLQTMQRQMWKRTIGIGILLFVFAGPLLLGAWPVPSREPPTPECAPAPPVVPATLVDVSSPVLAVVVSKDGKHIAIGCADKSLRLWDGEGRKQVAIFENLGGPVQVLGFQDKTLVVISVVEKGVEVRWCEFATGKMHKDVLALECPTRALALSPDGKTLACGNGGYDPKKKVVLDGTVELRELAPGKQPKVVGDLGNFVNTLAFSADGKYLAAAGEAPPAAGFPFPGKMAVWDLTAGNTLFAAQTPDFWNRTIAFSPDGKRLAIGGSQSAGVWELAEQKETARLNSGECPAILFSADSKEVFTGNGQGAVRRWDANTGKAVDRLWRVGDRVNALAIVPDSDMVVAVGQAGKEGALRRWTPTAKGTSEYYIKHGSEIFGLGISPDGKTLLAASQKQIHRWNLAEAREMSLLTGHKNWTWAATFSPDGKLIATAGEEWNTVRLFDAVTGKEHAIFTADAAGMIHNLAFSPDGKTLASAGNLSNSQGFRGGRIALWDIATGKGRNPFPDAKEAYFAVAFSPDGKAVAGGCMDGKVRVYDVATGRERLAIAAHPSTFSVQFTPDGKRIVSGGGVFDVTRGNSNPGEIKVWDATTGKELAHLKGHKGEVRGVAVSADGKHIGGVGSDGMLTVWDAEKYRERWHVKAHHEEASAIVFTPDSKTVITSGWDGRARLWDLATAKERIEP